MALTFTICSVSAPSTDLYLWLPHSKPEVLLRLNTVTLGTDKPVLVCQFNFSVNCSSNISTTQLHWFWKHLWPDHTNEHLRVGCQPEAKRLWNIDVKLSSTIVSIKAALKNNHQCPKVYWCCRLYSVTNCGLIKVSILMRRLLYSLPNSITVLFAFVVARGKTMRKLVQEYCHHCNWEDSSLKFPISSMQRTTSSFQKKPQMMQRFVELVPLWV